MPQVIQLLRGKAVIIIVLSEARARFKAYKGIGLRDAWEVKYTW